MFTSYREKKNELDQRKLHLPVRLAGSYLYLCQFYQNIPHVNSLHVFTFGLGLSSSNENWHLAHPLVSAYLYHSVCKKYQSS